MKSYKGVIFDLDGVIVSTDHYHYLAWKEIANQVGAYFDEKINDRLRGVSRMDSLEIILENTDKQFSLEEKLQLTEAKNKIYVNLLENVSKANILENIDILINGLKNIGVKIAIGSVSKNAELILKKIGLYDKFDVIIHGNKIKKGKPHPEVFVLGIQGLSLSSEDVIVVEDATAGIDAGISAGADTLAVGAARGYLRSTYSSNDIYAFFDKIYHQRLSRGI